MNSDYADVVPDVSWQLLVEISKYDMDVFFPGGKISEDSSTEHCVDMHVKNKTAKSSSLSVLANGMLPSCTMKLVISGQLSGKLVCSHLAPNCEAVTPAVQ